MKIQRVKTWPARIKAGDDRLLLQGRPPLFPCRVISEELFQKLVGEVIGPSSAKEVEPLRRSERLISCLTLAGRADPESREDLLRLARAHGRHDPDGRPDVYELEALLDKTLAEILLG